MVKEKTVKASCAELAQIMFIEHANFAGNIHGGEIIKMMDNTAGVSAVKHAGCNVVTTRVDEIEFLRPIYTGNVVTCKSYIVFVGQSSMEMKVVVEVQEMLKGLDNEVALTGYITMVALDENGKPVEVPRLKLETAEERALFAERQTKYEYLKKRRQTKA